MKKEIQKEITQKEITQKEINYIDLFAGAGGLSLGFDEVGFKNVFSLDIKEDYCETYKHNFPTHMIIQKIFQI